MEEEFNGQKTEQEADPILDCAGFFDACWGIFRLGNVVVESYNWACEKQWGVGCIGKIISERKVFCTWWCRDTIPFGKI